METKTKFTPEEDVPAVTDNVDSTPKGIAVGAAILLGLAFGIGCWVWIDGATTTAIERHDGSYVRAENYDYFDKYNKDFDLYFSDSAIPTPFETTGHTPVPQVL